MRDSALELAPAKAGKRVSWAREIREDLPLAFGFTVPRRRPQRRQRGVWHDAVLVLRLWVPPRPGLQRGCRRDVSLLLYSFVRSFQVVPSERGALVGR